jgi:ABC-2 type transport system ATP-binding protein
VKTILQIENVKMLYDKKHGIKNIDLVIYPGEILSFIGPNGAGKTTAVKCIAGLQNPQKGRVLLDNCNVIRPECKKK